MRRASARPWLAALFAGGSDDHAPNRREDHQGESALENPLSPAPGRRTGSRTPTRSPRVRCTRRSGTGAGRRPPPPAARAVTSIRDEVASGPLARGAGRRPQRLHHQRHRWRPRTGSGQRPTQPRGVHAIARPFHPRPARTRTRRREPRPGHHQRDAERTSLPAAAPRSAPRVAAKGLVKCSR